MTYTYTPFVNGSAPAVNATNLNAMQAGISGAYRPYVLNVKDYGAVGDGVTNDSAAFAAAVTAAKNSRRTLPLSLQPEQSVSVIIDIPPGDYLITTASALLGNEGMTSNGRGLRFRGYGKMVSNIIFKPVAAGSLMTDDYWMFVDFEHLGFLAATTGCTFLLSNTTHAAQRFTFANCRWEQWKYGVDLRGTNNNSEFAFTDFHINAHQNDGVFFYVGASGSDQFLNFWFDRGTFWSTQASFLDMTYGGSVHINELDVSAWGSGLTATKYLFALRGASHADGVCAMQVNGLRWEAMSTFAALLYSEWPLGNVAFRNVDMSSQVTTYTYGDVIYLNPSNTSGAALSFRDSHLAGGVRIVMAVNTYAYKALVKFEECGWRQRHGPSDVVSYDTSGTGGNVLPFPPVEFVNCRSLVTAMDSAAGAAVWDATIGYRGQPVQTLRLRTVSVRTAFGLPFGTSGAKFTLPTGALITSMEVMSPAGAVTEADGGTWTLATTEATPTTVATVTVTGAMSAGFGITATMSPPFLCDTAAKATLTVTPTNVAQANSSGLLLIKGYW